MPPYVLDANVFIESQNHHYGMDFCPAFWDWLIHKNAAGRVFSIDRICSELLKMDDDLCAWVRARNNGFFLPFDKDAANKLSDVMGWVQRQGRFKNQAKETFAKSADLYLIAHALAHGHIIVTREKPEPNSQTKVKIPDVCVGVGVQYVSLWDMLRAEDARFVFVP